MPGLSHLVFAVTALWLGASDVHFSPFDTGPGASTVGSDTNVALFESSLAAMKAAVPDPSVVLLPGDFYAHHFAPVSARPQTIARIAADFLRAYPHATFEIALGNNDSACGDYRSELGGSDLATIARAWAPLVNRNNSAPGFLQTFSRDGHYVARLPGGALRLVVVNSVLFSSLYRGDCNGVADAAARELAWLRATLDATPPGMHNVVMMHVPPGYDVFATELAHGFVPWPLMQPLLDAQLLAALTLPKHRVAFVIAGHEHHFDARIAGNVPIVVFGSISPVYGNAPSFYSLSVDSNGSLGDLRSWSFDEDAQRWTGPRDFDRDWGTRAIDASELLTLHGRLETDAALRDRWEANSNGDAPIDPSARIWGKHWRIPWCAQTVFDQNFTRCARLERRELAARFTAAFAGVVALLAITGAVLLVRRRFKNV